MSNRDDDFFNDDLFGDFDDDDGGLDDFRNFNDDDDFFGDGDDLFGDSGGDDPFDDDPFGGGDDDFFSSDGGGDDLFADDDDPFSDDLFADDGDPFGGEDDPFGSDFDGEEESGGRNPIFIVLAVILLVVFLGGIGLVAAFIAGVVEVPGGAVQQTREAFEQTSAAIVDQNATVFVQQTETAEANGTNIAGTQTQAALPTETLIPSLTPTPEIDQEGTSTALAFTQAAELTLAAPTSTIDPSLSIDDQRATAISRLQTQIANEVLNTQVPATLTQAAIDFNAQAPADDAFSEVTPAVEPILGDPVEATAEVTVDPDAQSDNSLGGEFMFVQDGVEQVGATEGATAQYLGTAVAQANDPLDGTATAVVQTAIFSIDVTLTAAVADLFLTFPAQEVTEALDPIGTQVAQTLTAEADAVVPTLEIDVVQQTATALAGVFLNTPTPLAPTIAPDQDTVIATATTSQLAVEPTPASGGVSTGQLPQTGLVDDLIAGGPFSIFAMIFGLGAVIFVARRLRKRD